MAHFVKLDDNGVVIDAIVIDNEHAPDPAPSNSEPAGIAYISALAEQDERLSGRWIQTSYSGLFRGKYAGISDWYLADQDVFVYKQPFPSWLLDENNVWQAPIPEPDDSGNWIWDEPTLSWIPAT